MYSYLYISSKLNYPSVMTIAPADSVTTVADARAGLSITLRRFRLDSATAPVVMGSHRKPEAVLIPYERYQQLLARTDSESAGPALEHLRARRGLIRRLADANKIDSVAVFGSVARGDETATSDIDLLVEPRHDASLFDLAQFGIDMEQLLGRPVDVVSRGSLDSDADRQILTDAIPL